MNAQALIQNYTFNAEVINNQLKDLSHAESLVQATSGGHSINWLLGHVLAYRSVPLAMFDAEPVWSDEARSRYINGSDPIGSDGPGVLPLDELARLFNKTQDLLVPGLATLTPEELSADSLSAGRSVFERLAYYHFHETYHIGQMTIVANLLGKPTAYRG